MNWRDFQPEKNWHDWFAWYPVHAMNRWFWLETVQRKWIWNASWTYGDLYEVELPGYLYRYQWLNAAIKADAGDTGKERG